MRGPNISKRIQAVELAEERGAIHAWRLTLEQLMHARRDDTTPRDLEHWIKGSKARLAAAEEHERDHGKYSLLRTDHPFNQACSSTQVLLQHVGRITNSA